MPYGYMPPGEPRFGDVADAYDSFRVGYTALVEPEALPEAAAQPAGTDGDAGAGAGNDAGAGGAGR